MKFKKKTCYNCKIKHKEDNCPQYREYNELVNKVNAYIKEIKKSMNEKIDKLQATVDVQTLALKRFNIKVNNKKTKKKSKK